MNFAAVTFEYVRDPVANALRKVINWIQIAASKNADVVLFPEFVLGHYHKDPIVVDGPEIAAVSTCAQETGIAVCYGIGEKCGNDLYSAYVLCGTDGSIAVHRKTRWQTPRCPISLGIKADVHNLLGLKVGIMICSESRFTDVAQSLAVDGAQFLIMPHAYGIGGPNWVPFQTAITDTIAARCRETSLPAIVVGNTGEGFQGGCALVSAEGCVLYQQLEEHETLHQFRLSGTDRIQLETIAEQATAPYSEPVARSPQG